MMKIGFYEILVNKKFDRMFIINWPHMYDFFFFFLGVFSSKWGLKVILITGTFQKSR